MTLTEHALQRAQKIKLLVLDVDGVLTDGKLYFGAQGELAKTFNTQDGHGIKLLQQSGIACAIITARKSEIVRLRAQELGVAHVLQGVGEKHIALKNLIAQLGLNREQAAFVGDDWIDIPALTAVGWAVAVANARDEVKALAHSVTQAKGGDGAVREVCDAVLQAQGKFEALWRGLIQTD